MLQIQQTNAGSRKEWLVEKRYTFGTGIENHYKVSGSGVKTIQAGLEVNGDDVSLFNIAGGESVSLNDNILEKYAKLKGGDHFSVGDATFEILDPKQQRDAPKPKAIAETAWSLRANNTALASKIFSLKDTQTIGRANKCDICLNVVHLSREHARMTQHSDHILVEDLDSSNGTFINGKRIQSAKAQSGDEITFDTLSFTLIGPQTSNEKTHVRPALDMDDATTMRPAITQEDIASRKQANAKAASKIPTTTPKVVETNTPKTTVDSSHDNTPLNDSSENSSQTVSVWIILAGIVITGVAIYFLLS